MSDIRARWLGAAAAYHGGLGVWMAMSPAGFANAVGRDGPTNEHFVRDNATTNLAFAVGLVLAVRKPSWIRPVLAVIGTQYVFHALSHVVDAGRAQTTWIGIATVAALGAVGLVVVAIVRHGEQETP